MDEKELTKIGEQHVAKKRGSKSASIEATTPARIYITGDCHADFSRFATKRFPEQKEMSRDDTMIICGDFGGVWYDDEDERHNLDWLSSKRFTTCFVDGNHSNFDRLYSDEFPIVDFHGGKAHKIRDGIYHLMRGYVFDFDGQSFFCMGGASSHDIRDGILDPANFPDENALWKVYKLWERQNRLFRVKHISWWEQEIPSQEEMDFAYSQLKDRGFKVDYVITHCLPTTIAASIRGNYNADVLTDFFDRLLKDGLQFKEWHCGHYHRIGRALGSTYNLHYKDIVRLI